MVPVSYNVRNLVVRKVTTMVTSFGIALVVFVFAASLMLNEGVKHAMSTSGRDDIVVVLRGGGDNELASVLDSSAVDLLRGHEQVAKAGAGVIGEIVAVVMAPHEGDPSAVSNVMVRAMPADGPAFRPELQIVSGRLAKPGTDEAMVGHAIAGRFAGFAVGGTIDLRHNRPLHIVGEFSAGGSTYESEVWGDVDYVAKALGRESGLSSARVRLNSASDFDKYRDEVLHDKRFKDPPKVLRESDYYKAQSAQIGSFLTYLGIVFAIMFSFAAMLGAVITMNGAVANRSREIGTLRALGFSRFSILVSFLFEAILLAVIGGVIGSAAVLVLGLISFPVMNPQTFSEIVIHFRATPSVFLTSLIFSGAMGLIGGLIPAIRASRVSPVEAMRA